MDPVEAQQLRARIIRPDVFVVRDKDQFWTYLSELDDGRWVIEYDPIFQYRGDGVRVVGPWGIREVIPLEASLEGVGRVMVGVTSSALEPAVARYAAAHISSHSTPLSSSEKLLESPGGLLEDVLYEILDGSERSGQYGCVERYGDGDVFRFETGDEVPLDSLTGRLWPAGGSIDPPS